MIRARLAVFVAVVIVFAPGAGFGDGGSQRPGLDIAAGMLAPTFDEPEVAAYNSATFSKKAQEKGRRLCGVLLATAVLAGAMYVAGSRPGQLPDQRSERHRRGVASFHFERGPPQLQLA